MHLFLKDIQRTEKTNCNKTIKNENTPEFTELIFVFVDRTHT